MTRRHMTGEPVPHRDLRRGAIGQSQEESGGKNALVLRQTPTGYFNAPHRPTAVPTAAGRRPGAARRHPVRTRRRTPRAPLSATGTRPPASPPPRSHRSTASGVPKPDVVLASVVLLRLTDRTAAEVTMWNW